MIEEFLQIEIDDGVATVSDELLSGGHRLMRRASGPEPIARRREGRVPILLQHLHHCLLEEAVEHRRNAEAASASRCLRNVDAPHRLRLVGAVEKLSPDLGPVVFQVGGQIVDSHAVDAGRALVAPDLGQRLLQIVAGDNPLHHRSNRDRWAFAGGCRRRNFGSSGRGTRGFTLRLLSESQLKLEFLPLGPSRQPLY